jgi:hypothetical protein
MNTRLHASSLLIGSFMLYTGNRFLARWAAQLLARETAAMGAGTVLVDGIPVRWRNLAAPSDALHLD